MDFPANDAMFEEQTIEAVEPQKSGGWLMTFKAGWCFYVPADSPVEPKPGMVARQYGLGIGYRVRGLFLDGRKVYYRTKLEDDRHTQEQTYGNDTAEWLARWDKS